jgi:hypothetical protein
MSEIESIDSPTIGAPTKPYQEDKMKGHKIAGVLAAAIMVVSLGTTAFAQHNHAHAKVNKKAPEFQLTDINGKAHKLSDYKGKFVVLEWSNPDCPFVKKHYSGSMQALQKKYGEKDVVWFTINSSAPGKEGHYAPADMVKKMAPNKSHSTAYLLDSDGSVGHVYGAKTTPHMYVIDPSGSLVYSGAIDDKPSTKKEDLKTAKNYVQECLDACLAGKALATSATTPYGCSVKYAKK